MDALAHALMGALLPLPAWIWLRQQVHARFSAWVLLDAAPWCAAYLICLATTARPLFSGAVVAGALIFMAIAQAAKRATLGDGLVFTDGGLLWQVFAHPRFYLPFVPRPILVLAALGGLAAAVALLSLEPGLVLNPQLRIAALVVSLALLAVILRPLFLLGRTTPARDPVKDAAHFGPLACFALHARLAAVARPGLQATYSPASALHKATEAAPHLVLLQLESFCDPRRFGVDVALPHKNTLCGTALSHGALQVSAFGANTMRTEFAVLTGIADTTLGLDRFNPYFRFARQPLRSLAWHLRHAGYQAACWHPFNPGFFGRDKVLPALGFTRFEAATSFAQAERLRGLVSDAAIAERLTKDLASATSPCCWYVITIAAHGPWPGEQPALAWADCMRGTDAMLGDVMRAAQASKRPVVIAAFGDHRPALAEARGGTETDYLIWRSDRPMKTAATTLDPVGLHHAIMAALGD